MTMQCKDIPTDPILRLLATARGGETGTWLPGTPQSVQQAMPDGVPPKLAIAKMRMMLRAGLVGGCGCGCRGDFAITEKGRERIAGQPILEIVGV